MKRKTKKHHAVRTHQTSPEDHKKPFIEHLYELRQRLFYVALSVTALAIVGYFIQQQLVHFLLRPAHDQQFIYTTPGGGINFLFSICIYFGIALSIPVLIYQILRYIEPLIEQHTKKMVLRYSLFSGVLAIAGGAFGYFLGLPVALRFLAHQFTTTQIKPLLSISDYMSFVTIYLIGSALLFQLPLIILFINRIRPLPPRKLLGFERYMILIAFIAAAILTPTTDIFDQLFFAGPIIATYQLAVILVYLKNRKHKPSAQLTALRRHDDLLRQARLDRLRQARTFQPPPLKPAPRFAPPARPAITAVPDHPAPLRGISPTPRTARPLIFDVRDPYLPSVT